MHRSGKKWQLVVILGKGKGRLLEHGCLLNVFVCCCGSDFPKDIFKY